MSSADLMHRFLFDHTDIRGEVVTLGDSHRQVLEHNQHAPVVQRLLGEFLAAVSLLSSTLKFDGSLTLQARGDGPLPLIMVECSHHQDLRGIARPDGEADFEALADADLTQLLGQGVLTITVDPTQGQRYQGIVPLDQPTLAGCLEHYFQQSEQLDTRLWFAADEQHATGLLLQALPQQINASAEENQAHWQTACTLAETVKPEELLNLDHETLLYRLFNEEEVRLFEPVSVSFACSCSRARSAHALTSLGRPEVEQLLKEQGSIVIDCQFCNQVYKFDSTSVDELFEQNPTLH